MPGRYWSEGSRKFNMRPLSCWSLLTAAVWDRLPHTLCRGQLSPRLLPNLVTVTKLLPAYCYQFTDRKCIANQSNMLSSGNVTDGDRIFPGNFCRYLLPQHLTPYKSYG